jgi:hypothetical protein
MSMTLAPIADPDAPGASASPQRGMAAALAGAWRWLTVRPYAPLGPLLLYLVVAIGLIYPFWPTKFRGAGDLSSVVGTIVEAGNAVDEGQFPLRVTPNQHAGTRYAFFQFYGNFPYTVTAVLLHIVPGGDPYLVWKITTVLSFMFGGFYTWKLCRRLTRRNLPSIVAGIIFITAPYMFADFVGRGAFSEFVAFNLLPAVFYHAWRAFTSPGLGHICRSAIAWALLGLSHNITYMYGVTFLGLWFLMYAGLNRRYAKRLWRVVAGGLIHGLLVLWYLMPQITLMKSLMIGVQSQNPIVWSYLTTLRSLLWPIAYVLPLKDASTPYLTLQIGVPILACILLGCLAIFLPKLKPRQRGMLIRAIALCIVAFVLAWTPFDVWKLLPKLYGFVQFPYRVLMFIVLFGVIAGAGAMAWLINLRRRWQVAMALLLVGGFTASYFPRDGQYDVGTVPGQVQTPRIGGLVDYLLTPAASSKTSLDPAGVNLVGWQFGVTPDGWLRGHAGLPLPTPKAAAALEFEGIFPDPKSGPMKLVLELNGKRHEFPVAPGPFLARVPTPEPFDGKPVLLAMSPDRGDGTHAPLQVSRVSFASPVQRDAARASVSATKIRAATTYGRWTHVALDVAQPSVVTLPVLYYPGLLTVLLDGVVIQPENVGRYVALQVEQGRHDVDITFSGVGWANWVSFVGWMGVMAVPVIERRRRRRALQTGAGREARFTLGDALIGVMFLVGGVLAARGIALLSPYFNGSIRTSVSADANIDPEHTALAAFDGDLATAWVAPPGGVKPILTIRPHRRAVLASIELESRDTGLWEGWHTVRVVQKRNGKVMMDTPFNLPEASRTPVQKITLEPTKADLIELHFSDPVITTKGGDTVSPNAVSPGYREIRLEWAKD